MIPKPVLYNLNIYTEEADATASYTKQSPLRSPRREVKPVEQLTRLDAWVLYRKYIEVYKNLRAHGWTHKEIMQRYPGTECLVAMWHKRRVIKLILLITFPIWADWICWIADLF